MTNLRLSPLKWIALAAGVTIAIRVLVALQVRAPVFYPDEYLTTDIARSIAAGSPGTIRGGSLSTYTTYTSYVVPLVQSPLWLIDNIDLSVRLSQALGGIAFALAAIPAYALGRRVGLSERGALIVALLTLIVPAGAFTATLLAEPYAYPLFLASLLLAVDAIATPSVWRHLGVVAAWIGLCVVGGLQFLYFGPVYAVVWVLSAWPSRATLLRRLAIVTGTFAGAVVLLSVVGHGRYVEVLGAVRYQTYPLGTLGSWFVVNAFVLAVAAGWVLVPGAVVGLRALARTTQPRRRAFALLTILVIVAMLFEAALWGANNGGVYERFTFYGAPLLAVAFVWGAEQTQPRRRLYLTMAYAAALAAIVLPVTEPLFAASDHHSPAINGLSEVAFGAELGGGIWAPALAVLAIGAAWQGLRRPGAVLAMTACVCVIAGVGQSLVLMRVTEDRRDPPHVDAPAGAAMLTWSGANPFLQLDVLFWNPNITRVVVVGGGGAADRLPSIAAQFVAPGALVAADGGRVEGPFVVGPDVVSAEEGTTHRLPPLATLAEVPPLLAFGFRRETGDLGSSGRLYAAANARPRRAIIRLRSRNRAKTMGVSCSSGLEKRARISGRWTTIVIPVRPHSTQSCIVYLIRGGVDMIGRRQVSVEASLALES